MNVTLVPGSGFNNSAGRVAQTGFENLSKTFQQLGQNKQDRLSKLTDIAGEQVELAEEQASRDVLKDSVKSEEFTSGVDNRYDVLGAKRDDGIARINKQFAGDIQTIQEEFKVATDGIAPTTRLGDGSLSKSQKLSEAEQTRDTMLRSLDTNHEAELQALNKITISAFESGEFDKVTNSKAYSDRIYKSALDKGLSPAQAEVLRKQEFERTKEAELTERQKYNLESLDKQERADNLFDVKTNTDKVTTQKASTRGTGGVGGVGGVGTNKAAAKHIKDAVMDKTYATGGKNITDNQKLLTDVVDSADFKPFFTALGDDLNSQDVADLEKLIKEEVGTENYTPAIFASELSKVIKNRDSFFFDKNVPTGERKDKFMDTLEANTVTALKENASARSNANTAYLKNITSTATGNKDVITTATTGTTAASKKALAENRATRTAEYAKKREALLGKGRNETSDQMVSRLFGDKDYSIAPEGLDREDTPKTTAEEVKEPKKPKKVKKDILEVTPKKKSVKTDDMGLTKQDRDVFKAIDDSEAPALDRVKKETPQQKVRKQEAKIKATTNKKASLSTRKKAYDSLDAEGKVIAYNKWKKDNPSGAFGIRDALTDKDSDNARIGAYMSKGIKDTVNAATTIQSERGRAAWKKDNPTVAAKIANTQSKIDNIQSKLAADFMDKPNMAKTKATLQKEVERLTTEQETLVKDSNDMQLNSNKYPYKSLEGMVAGSARTRRAQELSEQRAKANRAKSKHEVPSSYEYEDEGANTQQRITREAKQAQQAAVLSDVAAIAGGAKVLKEGIAAGSNLAITKAQKLAKSLDRTIDSVDSKALTRRMKLFEDKKLKNDFSFGAKADVREFVETAHKKFPKYADRIKYLKSQGFSTKAAKSFAREL